MIGASCSKKPSKESNAPLNESTPPTAAIRRNFIRLLAALKSEVSQLSKTNQELASRHRGFGGISPHEATRKEKLRAK